MRDCYILAPNRGILLISGPDRQQFLQGLITNDIYQVTPQRPIYSALLSPQGRFMYDFFIIASDNAFLLDCEHDRLDDLRSRLQLFKLRSDVSLEDVSADYRVLLVLGAQTEVGFTDPRLPELGSRAIVPADFKLESLNLPEEDWSLYDQLRISLGVPDGSRDMIVDKAIPLECGLDELNAIDWDKGCYMGQELTARTKHRGLVRKRLLPVKIEGPTPEFGAKIVDGDKAVGSMRSTACGYGLALLRLESLGELTAGDAAVTPYKPEWMNLPS